MAILVLGAAAAWLCVYLWRVGTGRKAIVVTMPSFLEPHVIWARHQKLRTGAARMIAGDNIEDLGDGTILLRTNKMGVSVVTRIQTLEVDHPYASKTMALTEEHSHGQSGAVFWEVHQADPRPYGGLLILAVQGRFSPLAVIAVWFAFLIQAFRVCWLVLPGNGSSIDANTEPAARAVTEARKPLSGARPRKGPAQSVSSFAREHQNEIILSLIACASFAVTFGFDGMLLLAPIILLHEYGHLLGYQLTGKTGNKMMLVPFFGGIAVAGSEHKTEFDNAFCSIMGPAICLPLSVALTGMAFISGDHWSWWWFAYGAMLCSSMNALNLLPMMPLDGGHSFASLARSISPSQVSMAMLVLTIAGALLLQAADLGFIASVVGFWGISSVVQDWNRPSYATPLNGRSGLIIAVFHLGTGVIHAACALIVWNQFY